MPATNPRITITLEPALDAILRRLSALTGESRSGLVAGVLQQSVPVFERAAKLIEAAQVAKASMNQQAADELRTSTQSLERQLGLTLEVLDVAAKPIILEAEAIRRRSAGAGGRRSRTPAPSAPAPTPMSNRGVRSRPPRGKPLKKSGRG